MIKRSPKIKREKRFGEGLDSESEEDKLSNVAVRSRADKEVDKYLLEIKEKGKTIPRSWWNCNLRKYPLLSKLACKYLCVLASSTQSERDMSKMGVILTRRRLRMKGQLFNMLMFFSDVNIVV